MVAMSDWILNNVKNQKEQIKFDGFSNYIEAFGV